MIDSAADTSGGNGEPPRDVEPDQAPGRNGEGLDDDAVVSAWQAVIDGFSRTHRRVLAPVEAAGLPEPHFAALMLLAQADQHRLPMSRLAQELGMTSGGFTKLADRLARDGMIDRRNSVGDRRVVYAALTELGVTTVAEARVIYVASVRTQVLGVVGGDGLRTAAGVLRRLRDANQGSPPEGTDAPPFVPQERDPSLPDRRERGR